MKNCLGLILVLIFALCSYAQSDSKVTSAERAAAFFTQADELYFENGSAELYGETVHFLVPVADNIFPARTNALERLHTFDLSPYVPTQERADECANAISFYAGMEDARCKITLGLEEPGSDMVISFLFDDGTEYHLKGAYSFELVELVSWVQGALTTGGEVPGNIRITELNETDSEPHILLRGSSMVIQDVFALTMEKTAPAQNADCQFDLKLEVIDGPTYFCSSDCLSFWKEGDEQEQVYTIECDEDLADALRMALK